MTRPGVPMTIWAPMLEAAELALVGLAAVDGELADAALEEGQLGDLLGDLDGKFARGAEDDDLGGGEGGVNALDGGDGEGGGFAGAGLGLADDVRAGEEGRDGGGLDWGGLLEPDLVDGLQEFGGEAKLGKKFLLHECDVRAEGGRQYAVDGVSGPYFPNSLGIILQRGGQFFEAELEAGS